MVQRSSAAINSAGGVSLGNVVSIALEYRPGGTFGSMCAGREGRGSGSPKPRLALRTHVAAALRAEGYRKEYLLRREASR